ncbi:sodium:solute symporter [Neorhodopirellula pilleata]|uniref:Sodium/glucose cotransporter n=1 Tax=Neorhodopirellula pilleata TaxID=2714738 RepID=A0A5C6ABF8_9BACT|nr:sodium:solute symporter [Neorhodopirellula pilleata]TWT95663.1 Sodium/glucose cotransporter [Neorhodopirellula pilleata]
MTSSLKLRVEDAWLPALDWPRVDQNSVWFCGAIDPSSSVEGIGGVRVHLSTIDIVMAVCYLIGIVAIGLFAAWHHKKKQGAADEYFLAGNSLGWASIGMALFATNISTLHLVSLAQNGFDTGLLNGNFEWMAGFTLVLLGLFFAPFYIRAGVSTLPDFLERRYNRVCRDVLAFVSIMTAIVIHIAFALLTGGIILEELLEIPMMYSIIVLCVLTGIYTIVGGLLAVVVTECIQTVVLLLGAALITGVAFWQLGGSSGAPGGWDGWQNFLAILEREDAGEKLSMLRPHGDKDGMPWYSVLLGYPVLGIWYWCADQTIVQRVLGAKSEWHARQGPVFAGVLKILPVFLFVLPGLMAYALFRDGRLDLSLITVDGVVESKGIYASMITELLPLGFRGVLVAALMAALMSTVSGALNSISTLVSYDIVRRIRPSIDDLALVRVGRIAAGVALVIAVALVPALNLFESIFNGMASIISHIAPPITCVLVLGVFWRGASSIAAATTLIGGSLLGTAVFAINTLHPTGMLNQIPGGFMMMAFTLFVICVIAQVAISLLWPDTARTSVAGQPRGAELAWETPLAALKIVSGSGLSDPRVSSACLIAVMVVLYWWFQ